MRNEHGHIQYLPLVVVAAWLLTSDILIAADTDKKWTIARRIGAESLPNSGGARTWATNSAGRYVVRYDESAGQFTCIDLDFPANCRVVSIDSRVLLSQIVVSESGLSAAALTGTGDVIHLDFAKQRHATSTAQNANVMRGKALTNRPETDDPFCALSKDNKWLGICRRPWQSLQIDSIDGSVAAKNIPIGDFGCCLRVAPATPDSLFTLVTAKDDSVYCVRVDDECRITGTEIVSLRYHKFVKVLDVQASEDALLIQSQPPMSGGTRQLSLITASTAEMRYRKFWPNAVAGGAIFKCPVGQLAVSVIDQKTNTLQPLHFESPRSNLEALYTQSKCVGVTRAADRLFVTALNRVRVFDIQRQRWLWNEDADAVVSLEYLGSERQQLFVDHGSEARLVDVNTGLVLRRLADRCQFRPVGSHVVSTNGVELFALDLDTEIDRRLGAVDVPAAILPRFSVSALGKAVENSRTVSKIGFGVVSRPSRAVAVVGQNVLVDFDLDGRKWRFLNLGNVVAEECWAIGKDDCIVLEMESGDLCIEGIDWNAGRRFRIVSVEAAHVRAETSTVAILFYSPRDVGKEWVVAYWDARSGRELARSKLEGGQIGQMRDVDGVSLVTLSGNGRRMAACVAGKVVFTGDCLSERTSDVFSIDELGLSRVTSIALNDSGNELAVGCESGLVYVIRSSTSWTPGK